MNPFEAILSRSHPRSRAENGRLSKIAREVWLQIYALALKQSERFEPQQLASIQEKRLMTLLERAKNATAFYREHLKNIRTLDDFYTLPPLSKHDLRKALDDESVLNKNLEVFKVQRSTSGSSGVPFIFFHDRNMYTRRIAFYRRLLRWAGHEKGDVAVWIMREMHPEFGAIPFVCFGPEDIEARKEELYGILEEQPIILHAMTSHLVFLADLFERDHKKFNFKGIISYAEPLPFEIRQYLQQKFNAPIFDNYGSQEILNPANECEFHNGFHINSEWTYIEVLDKNHRPLPPGKEGVVVMTSFDNEVMPFIRYKIGDIGYLMEGACPCGRTLPRIKISGRDVHYFIHPNGHVGDFISLVSPILQVTPKVLEFQIIRHSKRAYTVNLVPTPLFDEQCRNAILQGMRTYLGKNIQLAVKTIGEIPLGPGGKPRVFVNLENDLPTYSGK